MRERRFNRKVYKFYKSVIYKETAEKIKRELKKRGYLVRVTEGKGATIAWAPNGSTAYSGYYDIWIRKRR